MYAFRYIQNAPESNLLPEYIEEGIEAHQIIQDMFINKVIPEDFFDPYVEEKVKQLINKLDGFHIEIEKQFYLDKNLEKTSDPSNAFITGKIDVLATSDDTVYVIEFKNGFREMHEHKQILLYLFPYLDYQKKIGITLTPKNYYESEFTNEEIIINMTKFYDTINQIENTPPEKLTAKIGSHCAVCPFRLQCEEFQNTLMAKLENTNIVDRIIALEIELKELKAIAKEKAKETGEIESTNGQKYGFKPVFEIKTNPQELFATLVRKGYDPFNVDVGKKKSKIVSIFKVDSDAIKSLLRKNYDEDIERLISYDIAYYRFDKISSKEEE
jgi:hypothetical protein